MYNLNGSMSGAPMLGVDGGTITTSTGPSIVTTSNGQLAVGTTCSHTPLTPEILNSVMAMTNPLEYSFSANNPTIISTEISQPSTDSHSSSSGSPFESPKTSIFANGRIVSKEITTPTVQQTCSQLIKTSLKLSLEMKRKISTTDSRDSSSIDMPVCKKIKEDIDTSDDDDDDDDDETSEQETRPTRSSNPLLTNEDEDRRRRRRERNKIAATKCRMKKRERTINLVGESETLDAQNVDLKQQLRNLEIERRTLTEMLKAHTPNCMRGTRLALPVLNVSIEKFLNQIALGTQNQQLATKTIDQPQAPVAKNRNTTIKVTPQHKLQKIPSVNTLKFNGRHQNPINEPLITNNNTTIMSPMTMAVTTTSTCIPTQMNTNLTPITECKPLPSIDMGFCEGRKETMTPTNSYCKSMISSSSDCYAMSSPDSGFIKSPVDMGGNYGSLPGLIIKSDYIPNCEADLLGHHHRLDVNDSTNGDGSIDFILKSELVDLNDSPYTTVQSADRFLFDEVAEAFDPDMDGTNPNHSHSSIIGDHSQTSHLHVLNKEHLLLNGITNNNHINNNNNNSNQINNNHHHHQHHHPHHLHHHSHHNGVNLNTNLMNGNDHLHNFVNNSNVISSALHPHASSVIEFNSCQQFMDASLLKSDFLSQNCEFLSLANDSGDSQFTTDLDSGLTTTATSTYTNITNGNGCLA